MSLRMFFSVALAVALASAEFGCAGKDRPVPVEGTVTLDGKPIAGAGVRFTPENGGGPPAYAETQADGSFQLNTFNTGDGALPGTYKVTITWEEPVPPAFRDTGPKDVSREEMKKKMIAEFEKRRKTAKPSPVPAIYGDLSKTPLKQIVPPAGKVSFDLQSKPS